MLLNFQEQNVVYYCQKSEKNGQVCNITHCSQFPGRTGSDPFFPEKKGKMPILSHFEEEQAVIYSSKKSERKGKNTELPVLPNLQAAHTVIHFSRNQTELASMQYFPVFPISRKNRHTISPILPENIQNRENIMNICKFHNINKIFLIEIEKIEQV